MNTIMLSRIVCVCAAMLSVHVAAQDAAPSEHPSRRRHDTPVRMPPTYRGSAGEEMNLKVHSRLPGFAGVYFDRARRCHVIRIKRGQPFPARAVAREAFSGWLGMTDADVDAAVYEESDYDYAELLELKDRLSRVVPGRTGIGIDTRHGRVAIGVRDEQSIAEAKATLSSLGVPPAAVEIHVLPVVELRTLQAPL